MSEIALHCIGMLHIHIDIHILLTCIISFAAAAPAAAATASPSSTSLPEYHSIIELKWHYAIFDI